jgi:hypothetical protein
MKCWFAVAVVVGSLWQTTAFAQTAPEYTRYETVQVDAYRYRVSFPDPYAALPPFTPTQQADTSRGPVTPTYLQSDGISRLVDKLIYLNQNALTTEGYRVQILIGDRGSANNAKYQAQTLFPDHVTHLDFERPYFKVRIGDFYAIPEAEAVLLQARETWPGAFIVPATVNIIR